ncbi:MAG: 2,3-bisphosphoglycerate-independent phosphoglycerate mutase [Desulfobulbus sp.]|nr:2,3-bisphosphoglycerate-independent phosphoglycerate mutase [Desulfobulbus sp.]
MSAPVPVILAILDGWGMAAPSATNAVSVARTPNMDRLMAAYPMTTLVAHNGLVGLPEGQMGNSEVGHLNIGAGRIVYQDYTRINRAVDAGEFAANSVFNTLMDQVLEAGSRLHLCGLVSDGGVHSHIRHLIALVELAQSKGIEVLIHCFMDGRDTPPHSGVDYLQELTAALKRIGSGRIATVSGRYYAMDRDKRWDRVNTAWDAVVHGKGPTALDALSLVQDSYAKDITDEFILPTVLVDGQGQPLGRIKDQDAVLFFNFRADRVRELCHAFGDGDFDSFDPGVRPKLLGLVTMTEYEADFTFPVAFPPVTLTHILGEEISAHGRRQLRIAETEKYAHVTYFFNGGNEVPFAGEDRLLINSPRDVATYDLKPQMSAVELTDTLLETLAREEAADKAYDVVILNFANGDMVGHTGVMEAAVAACETVDQCIGRIEQFVAQRGGVLLITADHGNAEQMLDPNNGGPYTAHTLSPVPFIVVSEQCKEHKLRSGGALKDIAPTILSLMELPIPKEMEGESLIL